MARVTHVAKAQQRYETKPVLGEDGQQIQTPVMRNGVQRTTKSGRPIFMSVTERDLTKPLPPHTCDHCRQPIEIGTPYKHVTPKSGPYGGRQRNRHEKCPSWQPWDLSNSLDARIAQVVDQWERDSASVETEDDVTSALETMASGIRELAEEKQESASNMEEGFGHETEQSMQLAETAEALSSWADEIEGATVPEFPEVEDEDCEVCNGDGKMDDGSNCDNCEGTGLITPDEPTEDQIEDWRQEVADLSEPQNNPL